MSKRKRIMVRRSATVLAFPLILWGAAWAAAPARPVPAPATAPATTSAPAFRHSTADGVYSAEQLARGKKSYDTSCARCHGDALLGNDDAVALVGNEFLKDWTGQSVGKLVEFIHTQMPSDSPGQLSRKECTDITAYLLSANGFPKGKTDLPAEVADLNDILIQEKK